MARNSVRGTPYRHVENTAHEGIRPGIPKGSDGQTTLKQFRGTGMDTKQSARGTPYHSEAGNGPEARRVASHDKYGHVIDDAAGNQADPRANGSGVVFDGADSYKRGFFPHAERTMDSPVPLNAPVFEGHNVGAEDRAHLGRGNEAAVEDLVTAGGVMSRGMIGTSKGGAGEEELTQDDTLPEVAPAAKADAGGSEYVTTSKYK